MKRLLCSLLLFSGTAFALDGFYLGAQVGAVGPSGRLNPPFGSALGFGLDLGMPTGAYLDVMAHLQYSSHSSGGLKIFHPTFDAQFHVLRTADFDLTGEVGPGFYFFTAAASETKFGLNFGANGDVIVEDNVRLGLGFRYHTIFSGVIGDDFWTVMMRVGFQFN